MHSDTVRIGLNDSHVTLLSSNSRDCCKFYASRLAFAIVLVGIPSYAIPCRARREHTSGTRTSISSLI